MRIASFENKLIVLIFLLVVGCNTTKPSYQIIDADHDSSLVSDDLNTDLISDYFVIPEKTFMGIKTGESYDVVMRKVDSIVNNGGFLYPGLDRNTDDDCLSYSSIKKTDETIYFESSFVYEDKADYITKDYFCRLGFYKGKLYSIMVDTPAVDDLFKLIINNDPRTPQQQQDHIHEFGKTGDAFISTLPYSNCDLMLFELNLTITKESKREKVTLSTIPRRMPYSISGNSRSYSELEATAEMNKLIIEQMKASGQHVADEGGGMYSYYRTTIGYVDVNRKENKKRIIYRDNHLHEMILNDLKQEQIARDSLRKQTLENTFNSQQF